MKRRPAAGMLGCSGLWRTALVAATLTGCSSNGGRTDQGPCETTPPAAACGQSCATAACPSGFYCGADQRCTADCSADGKGCVAGQRCSTAGRCEALPDAAVRPRPDGSFTPFDAATCASIEVGTSAQTPTVILIVDKSSSMPAEFDDGKSRWDVVRETLLDPTNGVIPPIQSQVRFGLALYTATNGGDNRSGVPAIGECPRLELTNPALSNLAAISSDYLPIIWRNGLVDPVDPDGFVGEDTPTGDSITGVTQWLVDQRQLPSATQEPVIYLLATDGEPDRCEDGDPNTTTARDAARQEVITAVTAAYAQHAVRTYVLFVGNISSTEISDHMRAVAQAGQGSDDFYQATDAATLRSALTEIISGQLSCVLSLEGEITSLADACLGNVTLDGRKLTCGTEWRANTTTTIELLGAACDQLKAGAKLSATFPCGGIIIY